MKVFVVGVVSLAYFSATASSLSSQKPFETKKSKLNDVSTSFDNRASSSTSGGKILFPRSDLPYLALITMRDSCDSDKHTQLALASLQDAVSTGDVDLVSVRVNVDDDPQRPIRLRRIIQTLLEWSEEFDFKVVVSSDWMELGIEAGAHGVHFKEDHRHKIPIARQLKTDLLVGTSTHSVESAIQATTEYAVDYLFAGTCFPTESHPEKPIVEGPQLPAQVKKSIQNDSIPVLSIGGLDASNCADQVTSSQFVQGWQSDGVATIRAILQNKSPAQATKLIKETMRRALQKQPTR